ncbi:leukocyte-associated immunoglobulin-like receptor 1 isoform X2 [Desmodus rotundus]|uniref:leukocyte-associated immunoglobulin-like receptor 1 isoform X2 n=1 Tax=Desmodus rotundus TaxID=9430 RepID=UPI002380CAEE|nr:leukocyte-associated immunoglobulin-like receptor 1 isoform X2 [Desmodus rotundus]
MGVESPLPEMWPSTAQGCRFHQGLRTWRKVVLCLAQAIHMQEETLTKPSIWAVPGPVLRQGRPVTIVCRSPAWADTFRLVEKENISAYRDEKFPSQHGSQGSEARFRINTLSDVTARSYFCQYIRGHSWSEPSKNLELKVTDEDVSTPPSGPVALVPSGHHNGLDTKPQHGGAQSCPCRVGRGVDFQRSGAPPAVSSTPLTRTKPPSTAGLSPEHVYILIGTCVAFLLCLFFLILLLVHRQRQKKRGPPSSKGEEPRPQERLSPTVDITESTADVSTTVDTLPGENRDMQSPSPAAEDPEEVTYAQLDQRALTRRAARAESPQPTEPTADSSMYAALPPH